MDEQRLGELFRDAVGEAPPAAFGCADVRSASRRATAARRRAVAGGTLFGAAVLSGGLYLGGVLGGGSAPDTASAGRAAGGPAAEADSRASDPGAPHVFSGLPGAQVPSPRSSAPGGAPGGAWDGAPPAGCGPVDPAVVAAVTAVLAEQGIEVSGPVGEVPEQCAAGARSAAVPVAGGTLYVVVVPGADRPAPLESGTPDGKREYAVPLTGGRELVLVLVPEVPGEPLPLAEGFPALAGKLAGRL